MLKGRTFLAYNLHAYVVARFGTVATAGQSCLVSKESHVASNSYSNRTHKCGQLGLEHVGQSVKICGWLKHKRYPKFLVVHDVYGSVQVYNNSKNDDLLSTLRNLNVESVVEIDGVVTARPSKDVNSRMPTGQVEIHLKNLKIWNTCKQPLPVDVNDFVSPNQLPRMKYRYLDLRRDSMQHMLRFRAKLVGNMRRFLDSEQFVEVETPTLFRRTPGGANEFIVPSSAEPEKFYSLPQSPQQFKQLLMVAGLDRYYQVARCYRDEGSKSDRQPEFTQLDIELSFTDQEKVMKLVEDIIKASWPAELDEKYLAPVFDHMAYKDAMLCYGTDKPDLRYDWRIKAISSRRCDKSSLLYISVPDPNGFINAETLDAWRHKISKQYSGCVAAFSCYKLTESKFRLIGGEDIDFYDPNPNNDQACHTIFAVEVFGTQNPSIENYFPLKTLGLLRTWAADCLEEQGVAVRRDTMKFLWVTGFPLFLPAEDGADSWESAHHPFTAPLNETLDSMRQKRPSDLIGQHYDLVLNGTELGGGSIRIHDPAMQRYVLEEILTENCHEMQHLLDAFECGAPPHGGFAIGLDRYVSLLLKTQSIRDVIAFPKVVDGRDLMTQAPSNISAETLKRYHILIDPADKKRTCHDLNNENVSNTLVDERVTA